MWVLMPKESRQVSCAKSSKPNLAKREWEYSVCKCVERTRQGEEERLVFDSEAVKVK